MILPSILYGFFLAGVVIIYWLMPTKQAKLWVMLMSSLYFYASLQFHYVPLMLVLVGLNFFIGKALGTPRSTGAFPTKHGSTSRPTGTKRRARLLVVGIALNAVLLLGFKYFLPTLNTLNLNEVATGPRGWLANAAGPELFLVRVYCLPCRRL